MNQSFSKASAENQVYQVTVRSVEYFMILVEASSEREARELANHISCGYFHPCWDSEWDIENAGLVDDYNPELLAPSDAYESL
jgi:hypothetical protein